MSGVFQDMDRKTALPLRLCLFINDRGCDLVSPPESRAGDQGMVVELEREPAFVGQEGKNKKDAWTGWRLQTLG